VQRMKAPMLSHWDGEPLQTVVSSTRGPVSFVIGSVTAIRWMPETKKGICREAFPHRSLLP
jgi:hypothetical protein